MSVQIVSKTLGFGFKKIDDKFVYPLERNAHDYDIIIGKDVEISEVAAICKGSWRNTEIGDGSKIDNFVHVAHNVIIGKNVLIVAGVVIGGSCEIGDNTFIGMGALIRDHVKIGKNCFIEMGAVVAQDMPDDSVAKTTKAEIKRKVKYIGW